MTTDTEDATDRIISDLYAKARKCDEAAARVMADDLPAAERLTAEATGYLAQADAIIRERQAAFMRDVAAVIERLLAEGKPAPVGAVVAVGKPHTLNPRKPRRPRVATSAGESARPCGSCHPPLNGDFSMCKRSMNMSVRTEVDGPALLPAAMSRVAHWPQFVIGDGGPDYNFDYYVRRPGRMQDKSKVIKVTRDQASEHVDAHDACPREVGAFLVAAYQWADKSVELRQFNQLQAAVDLVVAIAMDMLAAHPRLCGCPLCVLLAALDDRQPGFRQTVWAAVADLPAALGSVSQLLAWNVHSRNVSTAKPIRLTEGLRRRADIAEVLAYPDTATRLPTAKTPTPKLLAAK